jgi:alanyl-tRNA synthetase
MTAPQIRKSFLDFFKSKQHIIVPSAPIVIKNDPTLLFTNAGMNQFKDYFLGNKAPEHTRVADTQKCLRVSGKHNDLEEVGVDTYHHTMFEMLGNWSFGDYFKKEAIAWSWELLTEVFKIDKDKIYVTVFEGDEKEGLPFDEEAYQEWQKWIATDRILKGNKKDNFWEMGDTGPCGPCSEIHVDCRPKNERDSVDGKTLVNADHPQVIEIWNNVFMQFNRMKDGSLQNLPAKHVDTGMGFERLVRVLQNKTSNYDTDVFTGTIGEIERITAQQYDFSDSKKAVAFRVLSDHIRAIAFTIADGQLPAITGAGYVIRRILRRAVRYAYSYLDYKNPLLFQLIPHLAQQFESVFPELHKQQDFVAKVIREEEDAFLRTLDKGLRKIDDMIGKQNAAKIVNGKEAFELYDTYGFPIDLTRLIAAEQGLQVDENGFDMEMQAQKNRSRKATATDTGDWIIIQNTTHTSFVGYDDLLIDTRVVKYRQIITKNKEQYQIVLEQTPFYPESGGQVGDTGKLFIGDEELTITDTKKENNLIIHFSDQIGKNMHAPVSAKVDFEKRLQTMYNHTATHLLHAALKSVLGQHVNQKGSLVSPGELRFDVSHFAKISDEELNQAERIVNEKIRANIPVVIKEMPKEEALKLGAMALFGEKYGDHVRVVTIDPDFSIELCGGTHVGHTGMIGLFTITSESAVAAGVRRIEALTGGPAMRYMADMVEQNKAVSALLKAKNPIKAIEKLLEEKAALEKKLESWENRELAILSKNLARDAEPLQDMQFVGREVAVSSADALKKLCFSLKPYLQNYLVVLAAKMEDKAAVAILIDENLAGKKNLDASKIIKQIVAPLIRGGGGGQKTLATAGGQDTSRLQEVIAQVKSLLAGN